MKCFGITGRRVDKDCLKHYYNHSEFVGLGGSREYGRTSSAVGYGVSSLAGLGGDEMSGATGVRGDVMDPASGLRGDAMKAASDVAVIR